jgi:hypothetical protein
VLWDHPIERRWRREIIDVVPRIIDSLVKCLQLLTELRIVLGRSRVHREVIHSREELLGKRSVVLSIAEVALKSFVEVLAISYIRVFRTPKSEDTEANGELILLEKLIERGDELTLCQVT